MQVREKVAAATFARGYLTGLVGNVFDSLFEQGYFYDPVEKEVAELSLREANHTIEELLDMKLRGEQALAKRTKELEDLKQETKQAAPAVDSTAGSQELDNLKQEVLVMSEERKVVELSLKEAREQIAELQAAAKPVESGAEQTQELETVKRHILT